MMYSGIDLHSNNSVVAVITREPRGALAPDASPHSGNPACRRPPFILSMYSGWKQYIR